MPVLIDAGTLREGVEALLPLCDYIVASETFSGQISAGGHTEALERLMAYGPKAAAVTLGPKGCIARAGDLVIESPGFAVDAVDTTGAGDVFHGAFAYGVLEGWDIERICAFSNAVAALKCRRLGGRAGIPSLDEALSFLARRAPHLDFS